MVKEPNIQNEEIEEDLITLLDEDNNEINFLHTATVEYEGAMYVFLQPAEDMEDIEEDEVVVFKVEKDEKGEDLFVPIEDEELLSKVYEEFTKLIEEYDEGDCGCGCGDGCDCGGECGDECDCGEEKEHDNCSHDSCKHEGCKCGDKK